MTDELKFPDSPKQPRDSGAIDERAAQLIREAYLPPVASGDAEYAYWNALEKRIMAGIASGIVPQSDAGWWSVLGGWAQVGLVAAAALFAVASVVSNQLGEPDDQVATDAGYEAVLPASSYASSAPMQLINAPDRSSQRDAALQYVLSY
jgi:hypothetical protein